MSVSQSSTSAPYASSAIREREAAVSLPSAAARKTPGGASPRGAALLADLKLMHLCDQVVITTGGVYDQMPLQRWANHGSTSAPQAGSVADQPKRSIAAQVFPPLEKCRLTVWHFPAVIDEHPWIADPRLLVAVKPADPKALSVDDPALTQDSPRKYRCTIRVVVDLARGLAVPTAP